jgi:NAD(P)-dependent dehydrogenase (short-subunit alcohol dehydrogenase family)
MNAMGMLDGKTAIVTGGARGLGFAIAKRYVDEGARVVIGDIEEDKGEAAARELGSAAHFVRTDVTKAVDVRNIVAKACDAWGGLDILVNNAGILHAANFLDMDEADFSRVMRVNVTGTFLAGQAAAKQMVTQVKAGQAAGAIVNMSSITARVALPDQAPYCASKGGIEMLTKVMALSLAPYGIRVNAIGPGSMKTDMLASVNLNPGSLERILMRTPLGRLGEPSEVASIAAFLASSHASYVTGETIFVDGGRLALNYTVPVALPPAT